MQPGAGGARDSVQQRGHHDAFLHMTELQRDDVAARWVCDGLANGELVLWLHDGAGGGEGEPPDTMAAVLAQAERLGADVDAARADGRLEGVPLSTLMVEGATLDRLDRALDAGRPGVRLTSDVRAMVAALGADAYLRREREISAIVRSRPVSVLCQYRFADPEIDLDDIAALHEVVRGPHAAIELRGHELVVSGSVDIQNHQVLAGGVRAAMKHVASHDERELRVALSATEFLSVSAWRALLDVTASFRESGGRVVLRDIRPAVATLLDAVDAGRYVTIEP